ncbi:MAG TPA: DMT family transporter [Acidimicrobiales bacterium]|jgi:drug/metabolite transporter (DMT)-like permease|nr:DMT family transporter [Acidimicrobiales bacterium]
MVVVSALLAAVAYAVAMVLQQRSAQGTDPATSLQPRLLTQLARQRWWLIGVACNGLAFVLRAVALAHGSLVLVQPLLLTGLVFALLLETRLAGRPFTGFDARASLALVGGLSLFALVATPSAGDAAAPASTWLVLALFLVPLVAVGIVVARRRTGEARAGWLAFAGGLLFAVTAALMKQTTALLDDEGPLAAARAWSPWALLAVGGLGVLVTQSAFQAGPLRASLPVLSVVEPLTSILIGGAVFGERIASSAPATLVEVAGLATMVVGVLALTTRSELVEEPAAAAGPIAVDRSPA